MSELFVKAEPEADAETIEIEIKAEEASDVEDFGTDEQASAELQANDIAQNTLQAATSYENLQWRLCDTSDDLSLVQMIETKESAAKKGVSSMRELRSLLVEAQEEVDGAKERIVALDNIFASKKECRITVGFLGTTGAGKSSLINALTGFKNLMPADDGKACTAVCVQIGWNADDTPENAFCAKVYCISSAEWKEEIEGLYKDISDENNNRDGEDGDPDLDRADRIKTAFQKLSSVYPQIQSRKDLASTTLGQLMSNRDVKNILSQRVIKIQGADLKQFASEIKPYIDSNNSKEDGDTSFALWPLVKYVSLGVKSPILKDGIFLVDLPGSHDTNAARGAIAEKYQKELNICCIVAPATRAPSDKPAQDLLGTLRQRTMALDDQFSSDKLCFIITKSDLSIDQERYIEQKPRVKSEIAEVLKAEKKASKDVIEAKKEEKRAEFKQLMAVYKPLKDGHTLILKKRKLDSDGSTESTSEIPKAELAKISELKEKIIPIKADLKKIKEQQTKVSSELRRAQDTLQEYERYLKGLKSNQLAACIKHRNEDSAKAIRKDYEAAGKAMGKRQEKNSLKVFGISSKAFMEFANGAKFVKGFKTSKDTGIPELREWLIQATLSPRKKNSEALLERIISFKLSATPWLADRDVGYKMRQSVREKIEKKFVEKDSDFEQALVELNGKTTKSCESKVETLFRRMPKWEVQAEAGTERVVRSFANKPMHWSTFRVINRNGGGWRRAARGDAIEHPYNWNAEMAELYLDPMTKYWRNIFHTKIPQLQVDYLADVNSLSGVFVNGIAQMALKSCPEIKNEIENWKESSLRTTVIIQKHCDEIFNTTIREDAANAHPLIASAIKVDWRPTYEKCGAEKGKGHYLRSQKLHIQTAQELKRSMYKKGSADVRTRMRKLFVVLPSKFDEGTNMIIRQMQSEFMLMLDNHTLFEDKAKYSAKKKLQVQMSEIFTDLLAKWSVVPEFEVEEEKYIPDEPIPSLDGLYPSNEDEDDDDDLEIL